MVSGPLIYLAATRIQSSGVFRVSGLLANLEGACEPEVALAGGDDCLRWLRV